jgi:hypothetical protein
MFVVYFLFPYKANRLFTQTHNCNSSYCSCNSIQLHNNKKTILLIKFNQRDDTFNGIYLYYATLHVSGICPSSGVCKEITITICVLLCIQIMFGGRARLQFYRGCGYMVSWICGLFFGMLFP